MNKKYLTKIASCVIMFGVFFSLHTVVNAEDAIPAEVFDDITEDLISENRSNAIALTGDVLTGDPIKCEKHEWSVIIDSPATCGSAGSQHRECNICHTKEAATVIPATGQHNWTTIIDTPATCGNDGSQHRECTVCHVKEASTVIPATGQHNWTTIIDTPATCGNDGSQHNECTSCHAKEAPTTIVATGEHTFNEYTIEIEPTVFEQGTKTRKCTVCNQTESVPIDKLTPTAKLNTTNVKLQVGTSTTKIEVNGLAKGDSVASYKSNNPQIATVDKTGKITAKKKGTAKITVKLSSGISKTITVTVQNGIVKTKKITVDSKKVVLTKGKTYKINAVLSPITSQQKITYKTSDKNVATVSSSGKIKAHKKGTAKITIQSGSKKVTIKVTVKNSKK